ncbi:hypothetical protein ONS95_000326 [Cadophora gregata]|uniref:uncharacterized protein n=1 Tax=Cadophora gregata TaxID=51156 RepID=UPI0026DADA88|nr:uncharacterized protein ONS95_000326 [Cadophora gregata]KAK0128354.1 hypothetical protein ONS95_000326 [Cadophora gregata]
MEDVVPKIESVAQAAVSQVLLHRHLLVEGLATSLVEFPKEVDVVLEDISVQQMAAFPPQELRIVELVVRTHIFAQHPSTMDAVLQVSAVRSIHVM